MFMFENLSFRLRQTVIVVYYEKERVKDKARVKEKTSLINQNEGRCDERLDLPVFFFFGIEIEFIMNQSEIQR
jgi:hypothetical protein